MTGPASWDARYSQPAYAYGEAPNAFLAANAQFFTPGLDVLVPADGEGRNGVWLAEQGCNVTSVDYSAAGIAKARELAARRGVALATIEADLTRWAWPVGTFDRVVAIYFHLPPRRRIAVHQAMAKALKPGGLIVIEAFRPEQIALQETEHSGGPPDAAMMFTPEMLAADFAGFEVVAAQACETVLDEGVFHRGRAAVVRFIARKPG